MKKYFTATLFSFCLILTSTGYTQSIYSRSIENSLSGVYSLGMTGDDKNIGVGGVFTIKSNVDLGFVHTIRNDKTMNNENGEGWGGFASFMLLNELKGAPLGLSLGLIYSQAKINKSDRNPEVESRALGLGFVLSKIVRIKNNNIFGVIPQLGFTALPINEVRTKYVTIAELNFTSTLAIGLPIYFHPKATLIIEPNTTYNYRVNVFYSGFSVALQLH